MSIESLSNKNLSLKKLQEVTKIVSEQLESKGRVFKSDAERLQMHLRMHLEKEQAQRIKHAKPVSRLCVTCDQPLGGKKLKFCSEKCRIEERKQFKIRAARGKAMCS